jgi:hypothetical protein
MRRFALLILLVCFQFAVKAQDFTAALRHSTTITGAPSSSGSRLRFNLTTGRLHEWDPNTLTWRLLGQGLDVIDTGAAPNYVPGYGQSNLVLSTISGGDSLYFYRGGFWRCLNCNTGGGGGGSGTVSTNSTLTGNGSSGSPLGIAQQSASSGQSLSWTGTTWAPSWGNPYVFVTSSSSITTASNQVLIGTLSGAVTFGLPTCNAANDSKRFSFIRNGSDSFQVTIDPSGVETFYDGASSKVLFGKFGIDCTCRFSAGVGKWFYISF